MSRSYTISYEEVLPFPIFHEKLKKPFSKDEYAFDMKVIFRTKNNIPFC
jgi:hypothetical protein